MPFDSGRKGDARVSAISEDDNYCTSASISTSLHGNTTPKLCSPASYPNMQDRLVLRCMWSGPQSTQQRRCSSFLGEIWSSSDQALKGKIPGFCQVLSIPLRREGFTVERHTYMSSTDVGVEFLQICHVLGTDILPKHQADRSFLHCLFGATHIRPVGGDIDLTGPNPAVT